MVLARFFALGVAVVLSSASAAPAAPSIDRAPRGIAVDAAGKTMGPALPYPGSGYTKILTKIDGALVYIPVWARIAFVDGKWIFPDIRDLAPTSPTAIYFSQAQCQGTPFLPVAEGETIGVTPSVVLAYGDGPGTIYIGSTGPFVEASLASSLDFGGACRTATGVARGVHVVSVRDLGTYFQVPYRIK